MGHWDPKSTSVSFCSISSLPLRGPLCYLPLLSLPSWSPVTASPPDTNSPKLLFVVTLSRLQTGSLHTTADFSNTSPSLLTTPKLHPIHGSVILRSLLSPPTSQPWDRIACPCPPFAWLVAPLYYVHPLGHRQLSPGFFYFSGHAFGLFCPLSLAQSKQTPSWGLYGGLGTKWKSFQERRGEDARQGQHAPLLSRQGFTKMTTHLLHYCPLKGTALRGTKRFCLFHFFSPNVNAKDQTPDLWKNSKCSWPLTSLP